MCNRRLLALDAVVLWIDNAAMVPPIQVQALPGFRLRLTYADGVSGEIDLSGEVGKGVFAPLADPAFFARVHLGEGRQICWSDDLDICPDAAYLEITGRMPVEAAHA